MLKNTYLLIVPLILSYMVSTSQSVQKGVVIKIKNENFVRDGSSGIQHDMLLVQDGLMLEPVMINYSKDKSVLNTQSSKVTSVTSFSGQKLGWYCMTDFRKMIGMTFDVKKTPSSKTIEPYEVDPPEKFKRGVNYTLEPYLNHGISLADYSKDKDTIINGQKCFLIRRTKIAKVVFYGQKVPDVVQFRLAINPALKSYAFPFISEKIVEHFGGGAIVYLDAVIENGSRTKEYFTYAEFTPVEQKLFDNYKQLYDEHITLLDRFKKKEKVLHK